MFVAASIDCFPELSPHEALEVLADLQFTAVEIPLHENGRGLKPSEVHADLERSARFCRDTHRLDIAALNIELTPGPDYYTHFTSLCKLAKLIKVVTLVVPCSELGTPFNEEIERLRKLVEIASLEGAVVAMKTTIGSGPKRATSKRAIAQSATIPWPKSFSTQKSSERAIATASPASASRDRCQRWLATKRKLPRSEAPM